MFIVRSPRPQDGNTPVSVTISTSANAPTSTGSVTVSSLLSSVSASNPLPTTVQGIIAATSSHPLTNAAIAGIATGVGVCLILSVTMAIMAYRIHRKKQRKSSRSPISFFSRGKGKRMSTSTGSLTSFDTKTDDGENGDVHKEDSQPRSRSIHSQADQIKQETSAAESLPLRGVTPSTTPEPFSYSTTPVIEPLDLSRTTEQTIHDALQAVQVTTPSFSKPLSLLPTRSHTRSRSSSSLPRIHTALTTSPVHARSTSDTSATPRRQYLSPLTPIVDQPLTPLSPNFLTSTLIPSQDSPHSLASLSLDATILSPQKSKGKARAKTVDGSSMQIPPLNVKRKTHHGASLTHTKSRPSAASYWEVKPLPPSPPAPPAPPPPFAPPLTPAQRLKLHKSTGSIQIQTTKSTTSVSSKYAKKSTSQGSLGEKVNPYLASHTYSRNTSSIASESQNQGKLKRHVSSLALGSVDVAQLQTPKPVLKVDTSRVSDKSHLLPKKYIGSHDQKSSTLTPTSGLMPTPVSGAKSAPGLIESQNETQFNSLPLSKALSATDHLTTKDQRPFSVTATIASSNKSPAPSHHHFEEKMPENPDLKSQSLASYFNPSTSFSSATPSMSTRDISNTASFLTVDPNETNEGRRRDSGRLSRSPSISVPIVFRFQFPRKRDSRGKN